jgi:tRNA-2-methylthio-N6-dimethylallyladenosine synthase
VRVQRGCDKFCTYLRRAVRTRPRAQPPAGAHRYRRGATCASSAAAREVTLLGQTVNSYLSQEEGKPVRMSDLLYRLNDVDGLERIRFVTSYPGDFGDDIFEAMRDLPKVCDYLHIPAQSGSNTVLKRMKRQYTVESYLELIARGREYVPDLSLAGDFIVGFCGETDEEFEESLKLLDAVQYKNIFCFKYSPRPNTVADKSIADDVPDAVKKDRNRRMLAHQLEISQRQNQGFMGSVAEVLVEGYSKAAIKAQEAEQTRGEEISWRRTDQLVGRTSGDRIVVFTGGAELIGRLAKVKVTGSTALTLFGEVVDAGAPARHPAVTAATANGVNIALPQYKTAE